jgi:GDPmannose 4,6-dehydratase
MIKMDNKVNKKVAFITGVNGMDGSYLTELLLEKGYVVHGLIRRCSSINTERINHIYQDPHEKNKNFFLHYGDMSDSYSLQNIINNINPDEVYNLAAMSHVRVSFDIPEYTGDIDGLGTLRLLEVCKNTKKNIKIYQAGTSELYGGVYDEAQNEDTPFYPRSPYAVAKLYSYWIIKNYREAYDMFAVNGILFNHTSPRRGHTFVEQKIVKGAVAISRGKQDCLYLGNIYTYRDFGHSKDFVEAMWLMLQQDTPNDYVIASDTKYLIKDIVIKIFQKVGIELHWYGSSTEEYAMWGEKVVIRIDPKYYRPSEVESLHGDSSRARLKLGWQPKYDLDSILDEMIEEEKSKQSKQSK